MPQLITGALIKAGVGTVASHVIGYGAYTAATFLALRALAPDMTGANGKTAGLQTNLREAAAPHDYVYGQVRKGGTITFMESTNSTQYLHIVIALAGHEVEEIGDIYINDEVVSLNGSGFVTSSDWLAEDGSKLIRIKKHTGSTTQTADSDLVAETSVTSDFRGRGIAYIYVRLEYDGNVFAGGIPTFTAVIKGKKVYDPRTASTAYSANAALCIRDYITSEYGLNDSNVNDTFFNSAANTSDESVTLSAGGSEARYEINGVVKADETPKQILDKMMTACGGTLYWSGGEWHLRVAEYTSPVRSLGLEDVVSDIQVRTRLNRRDSFNAVEGTFVNSDDDYIVTDYPKIESSTFLTEDNNYENVLDFPLPLTTSASAAQRLAKVMLYRTREQIQFEADFNMNAYDLEVGDIIQFTNARYGWTSKEFEVRSWRFFADSDAGDLRVRMALRETSANAFDWDADERAIISNNSTLPDWRSAPRVGISVAGGELRLVNQQVVGAISVDVTLDPLLADRVQFQYRQTGSTNWIPSGTTTGPLASNRFEVVGVSDGLFDFRARSINIMGVRGAWKTITGNYITLFTAPPQNVSDFSANVVGNTVHLTWTPTTDLDLSHYKIRFANATSGASYQNAIDLVSRVSRPANSITVPAQTGTYFIKAVDKLGNVSPSPTSIVVTTNTADIDALNVVETLTQNPSFAGSKSDVVLLNDDEGNYIALDTSTLFDSISGDFDDQNGLFDGGGYSSIMVSTGYYEFDDYIDLGQKYVSRVSTSMDIRYLEYADTFDAASGLFDSREGDFDGDPTQFDTTTARTQVSYTDDDPSASPTWSDWRDFVVGDISARAIRFRVALQTSSDSATPSIRELTATIDMPDRVEADDDITYTGSTSITFPNAFKAPPAIGIAASLADGDRYVISSKSRTGFSITTYTGGAVSTNPATIDYVAKGYGKELP